MIGYDINMILFRIVFDIINAAMCFFYLASSFLVSSFVVRRYDDIYA